MSGNSATVSETSGKRGPKSGKGEGICVVGGNLIVTAQQNAGNRSVVQIQS